MQIQTALHIDYGIYAVNGALIEILSFWFIYDIDASCKFQFLANIWNRVEWISLFAYQLWFFLGVEVRFHCCHFLLYLCSHCKLVNMTSTTTWQLSICWFTLPQGRNSSNIVVVSKSMKKHLLQQSSQGPKMFMDANWFIALSVPSRELKSYVLWEAVLLKIGVLPRLSNTYRKICCTRVLLWVFSSERCKIEIVMGMMYRPALWSVGSIPCMNICMHVINVQKGCTYQFKWHLQSICVLYMIRLSWI